MRLFVLALKSTMTIVYNFTRWISRYAWFSYFTNEWSYGITNPNPDAGLVNWNGALSELGRVYVSLGSGRRLTGNETENVTMPEFESNYTAPIFAWGNLEETNSWGSLGWKMNFCHMFIAELLQNVTLEVGPRSQGIPNISAPSKCSNSKNRCTN